MNKFNWIILNIFSFGGLYFWTKAKAKKNLCENNEIKRNNHIKFSVEKFIDEFGGAQNIKNISATMSTLKIELIKYIKVDREKLNKFNVTGLLGTNNGYTVVVGDIAKAVASEIQKKIRP